MEEDGHSDASVRNESARRSIRASSYHTACSVASVSFKAAQAGSMCGVVFLFIAAVCVASSSDGERIELDAMVRGMPRHHYPQLYVCPYVCLFMFVRTYSSISSIYLCVHSTSNSGGLQRRDKGEIEREKVEKYRESKRTVRDRENLGINRKGRRDMAKTEQRRREC